MQSAEISHKQDGCYMYVIIKAMHTPGFHHNDFVATHHAFGHKTNGYTMLVPMNQRVLKKLSKERNIIVHK